MGPWIFLGEEGVQQRGPWQSGREKPVFVGKGAAPKSKRRFGRKTMWAVGAESTTARRLAFMICRIDDLFQCTFCGSDMHNNIISLMNTEDDQYKFL